MASAGGRRSAEPGVDDSARGADTQGELRADDLLIRTGGEQRLSDSLLWEWAYAEASATGRGRTSAREISSERWTADGVTA